MYGLASLVQHLSHDAMNCVMHLFLFYYYISIFLLGAPVAQWVKRWPTDLAVLT